MPGQGFWGATKPPLGVPLDRGHPFSIGLAGEYAFNEGAGSLLTNGVQPRREDLRLNAADKWVASACGPAVSFASDALNTAIAAITRAGWTMACLISWGSVGNVYVAMSTDTGVNTNSIWMGVGSPGNLLMDANLATTINVAGVATPNTWMVMVGTYDGATCRLYKNGLLIGSGAAGATTPSSFTRFGVNGAVWDLVTYSGANQIAWARRWDRALSAAEVELMSAAAFANYAPPVWRRYFIPQAGVTFDPSTVPWQTDLPESVSLALMGV